MARPIKTLTVTKQQRAELESMIKRPTAEQRMVRRCRVILCRLEGLSQEETARKVGMSRPAVNSWEKRFVAQGLGGLNERKRSGRKPSLNEEIKEAIITEATRPPKGRTHWSTRSMARAKGVSNQTVHRLWKSNEIKPHLTRTFKVSNDKDFKEKFWDVIGLYLQPPDRALVLCCEEKSQCQALERSQPGLPLGLGHIRTRTHDYTRHGTLTLFAAMDYLDGKIFHNTAARHTHVEWLAFLKQIDAEAPEGLSLHLIVDNYCTHKHKKVRSWLKWRNQRHRKAEGIDRFVMHFTPTSSSWMNMVERFFRDITVDCIRDGSFASVDELKDSVLDYLNERNLNPKPYVWKAEGKSILEKIQRAKAAMPEKV
jgi:transposase